MHFIWIGINQAACVKNGVQKFAPPLENTCNVLGFPVDSQMCFNY